MIVIRLHIHREWRAAVLLICLLSVLPLSGSVSAVADAGSRSAPNPAVPAIVPAAWIPSGAGRHFYLTDVSYRTDQVLTACAAGYHMASLWEILDVSNLVYDYNHPAAHRKADSGYGPPSYWHGWVRTGWASSGSATTGEGNCSNWSSTSSTLHGVSVRLSRAWETAPGDISAWDANTFTCSIAGPVWCVGYFHTVYLPIVVRNRS
jgi:hypothetical protein